MFSERNVPVDFLSAREVTAAQLKPYKLVVVPYPILLLTNEARALEQHVREGGHLFTEARAGWVDERGYAQAVVPGFGWDRMLGVQEKAVTPKSETRVKWGSDEFAGAIFEERFTVLDVALASRLPDSGRPAPSSEPPPERATPVATFDDGSPAAFERRHGQGAALILGTFAGQVNDTRPVSPHPLGGLLCRWAGLALPDLKASAPVDFKQLVAPAGRLLFLLNWGPSASRVELNVRLDKPARQVREIISGEAMPGGSSTLGIRAEVPPQSARVYRVDY
jgi:beta-galactosidase